MRGRSTAVLFLLLSLVLGGPGARGSQDQAASEEVTGKAWAILDTAVQSDQLSDRVAGLTAMAVAAHLEHERSGSSARTQRALDVVARTATLGSPPDRSVALGLLPTQDATYLPVFTSALDDPDVTVRRAAVGRLGFLRDAQALGPLQDVLMRGDADTVMAAAGSARNQGTAAFGMLLRCIEQGGEATRAAALWTISALVDAGISGSAVSNLEALRRLTPNIVLRGAMADPSVRSQAALILARLGDEAGVAELVRMSEATDPRLGTVVSSYHGMAALNALGRPVFLARLETALRDADQRVRATASLALRSFPHPSVDRIWTAAWEGTSDVRYDAFGSLISANSPPSSTLLRRGLADANPFIQFRAAETTLGMGPDPASLRTLETLAMDPAIRLRALPVLLRLGDPIRTAAVARSLLPKTPEDLARMRGGEVYDPEYRLVAISILETVRDGEAVSELAALLGPDSTLNSRVARALAAIGGVAARRALVRAMDHPERNVRIYAAGGVLAAGN